MHLIDSLTACGDILTLLAARGCQSVSLFLFTGDAVCQVAGGSAECRAAEEAGRIADPDPAAGRLEDTCLVTIL